MENDMEIYEDLLTRVWENFFPKVFQTAKELSYEYEIQKQSDPITIQFQSKKTGNYFYILSGLTDGTCSYIRFLGVVCEVTPQVDLANLLRANSELGFSTYIDTQLFAPASVVALKYDLSMNAGFPDSAWFPYILGIFDVKLKLVKDEFKK